MVQNFQKAREEAALLQKQLNNNASTGFINLTSQADAFEKEITQLSNSVLKLNGELDTMALRGPFARWTKDLQNLNQTAINTSKKFLRLFTKYLHSIPSDMLLCNEKIHLQQRGRNQLKCKDKKDFESKK